MRQGVGCAVAAGVAAPLMLLAAVVVLSPGEGPAQAAGCPGAAVPLGPSAPARVPGFSGEQLANAAVLMGQAESLGLPAAAQVLVVQAAIGESTLRSIAYTDAAGTVDGWRSRSGSSSRGPAG